MIFLIFIANAVFGVWQESNAEKALEALKEIQSEHATIKRDRQWSRGHPACDLIPGDIIELLYNCDLR
jgi:magnesium-transporting ATPase (P-type)